MADAMAALEKAMGEMENMDMDKMMAMAKKNQKKDLKQAWNQYATDYGMDRPSFEKMVR